jgi:predicted GIY-YIG superfamily endonuclease
MPNQRFVYVLLSTIHENRYYTGLTADVEARLAFHPQMELEDDDVVADVEYNRQAVQ